MLTDPINILCASDDKYMPYCGIMLTSLFENNKDSEINVFLLIDKPLSYGNRRRIKKLSQCYHQTIHFVMVDNSFVVRFPTKGMSYWSVAMYYRMCATELLPSSIEKILYLDCDIIVKGSIKSLFQQDMEGKAVACVCDIFDYSEECQERLGYPTEAGYFNSGMLLMNLSYWREHGVGEKCMVYLKNNYNRLYANDQDVLNAVLWDKKIWLPLTYNYQIHFRNKNFYQKFSDKMKQEIDATTAPIIIHYASPLKPWNIKYYKMPFKKEWWYYKRKSPWRFLLPQLPKHKTVNYLVKRYLLWPLGIKFEQMYI